MRDLSLGESGDLSVVLANGRQLARAGDGRWLAITDVKQRVTGRASVSLRVSAGAVPLEDEHFRDPIELAGNLTAGLLGDPSGPADQGSIVVDPGDVLHAVWRRTARDGTGKLWYARCPLGDGDPTDGASWRGPGDRASPSRVDQEGRGPASLGDIVVTRDGSICIAYSQGDMDARRVVLARPAAGGWHRTVMTDRWDYGDPVLDVDEGGTLHLAYGPDPRGYADRICSVDFGEFEEEFLRDPRRVAERYGVYYTQSRDGDAWTRADGRTPGGRADRVRERPPDDRRVARHDPHRLHGPRQLAGHGRPGVLLVMAELTDGAGRWKMHVNLNRDESQEVASPVAFVDRYGQPRLAWVNRDRHHVFMSRWMGGGMSAPQGIRWAWELAPALSVEKRMPADGGVLGLLYQTAGGEIRCGRLEVPAIDPRRQGNVLFLDLWELAERRHVDLVVNTARKEPRNPVLQGEPGAWDSQAICYGTVLHDEGRYRMWYTARSGTTDCAVCCYAESADGITWERPNLGLFEYHGSTENNICAPRRDPAAGAADPQRPADAQPLRRQGRTRARSRTPLQDDAQLPVRARRQAVLPAAVLARRHPLDTRRSAP